MEAAGTSTRIQASKIGLHTHTHAHARTCVLHPLIHTLRRLWVLFLILRIVKTLREIISQKRPLKTATLIFQVLPPESLKQQGRRRQAKGERWKPLFLKTHSQNKESSLPPSQRRNTQSNGGSKFAIYSTHTRTHAHKACQPPIPRGVGNGGGLASSFPTQNLQKLLIVAKIPNTCWGWRATIEMFEWKRAALPNLRACDPCVTMSFAYRHHQSCEFWRSLVF